MSRKTFASSLAQLIRFEAEFNWFFPVKFNYFSNAQLRKELEAIAGNIAQGSK